MKEWILENTNVNAEEYEKILNANTVSIGGICKKQKIHILSRHPMVNIAIFTTKVPTLLHKKKLKITKTKDINEQYYYIYKKIKFYILTDFLKQYENQLHTTKRHNKCFHLNSQICLELNIQSYLITAMCKSPYATSHDKFIHTFILAITNDKKEYIIDATANIIMDKNTYFNIFKPKIISCIEKEQLKNDLSIISPLEKVGMIYKAEYFCFTDKVINGIQNYSKKQTK